MYSHHHVLLRLSARFEWQDVTDLSVLCLEAASSNALFIFRPKMIYSRLSRNGLVANRSRSCNLRHGFISAPKSFGPGFTEIFADGTGDISFLDCQAVTQFSISQQPSFPLFIKWANLVAFEPYLNRNSCQILVSRSSELYRRTNTNRVQIIDAVDVTLVRKCNYEP